MEIEIYRESVKELRDNYYENVCWDNFIEYRDGYIDDVIFQVANNSVDIYDSDLWDWARDNKEYIEEAVIEYGINTRDFNLIELFRQGQYLCYRNIMEGNVEALIQYYAYDYIYSELNINEISTDEKQKLEEMLSELNDSSKIDEIIDIINEVLGGKEDDNNC